MFQFFGMPTEFTYFVLSQEEREEKLRNLIYDLKCGKDTLPNLVSKYGLGELTRAELNWIEERV
jgi:hypothetical protein